MAINISPNRINVQSGNIGRNTTSKQGSSSGEQKIIIPAKADIGVIPTPDTLQTMIRSAVEAVRSGVFWERGTILNLVV